MPSIEQIIEDEVRRAAKRVLKEIVQTWVEDEATGIVKKLADSSVTPYLSIFTDQKNIIKSLQEQLEVMRHQDAPIRTKRTRRKVKEEEPMTKSEILKFSSPFQTPSEYEPPEDEPEKKAGESDKENKKTGVPELPCQIPENRHKQPCLNKARIQGIRLKRGLSISQLSILMGVPEFTIKMWEEGTRKPEVYQKVQLAGLRDMKKAVYHALLRKYNIDPENPEK